MEEDERNRGVVNMQQLLTMHVQDHFAAPNWFSDFKTHDPPPYGGSFHETLRNQKVEREDGSRVCVSKMNEV